MRVALLQLGLDSQGRGANLQNLVAGIHRAASTTPAPDLLVLPGSCDTGGAVPKGRLREASLQSVRETIAWEARDWGVYIAVGLHRLRDDTLVPWAALFDPDGDLAAQDPAHAENTSGASRIEMWQTAVGSLGVVQPSLGGSLADRLGTVEEGAFIAVPFSVPDPGSRQPRGPMAGLPPRRGGPEVRAGVFRGVVAPAGYNFTASGEQGWRTGVYDSEGNAVVTADNAEEAIVHAEVPLVSVVPRM